MPKKSTSKKQTRARKTRKAVTPSKLHAVQNETQDEFTSAGVERLRKAGAPMVDTPELRADELATTEARDAGLHIFKITNTQDEDEVYFAAYDSADAHSEMVKALGNIPATLVNISEVATLPEGQEFCNADWDAKLIDAQELQKLHSKAQQAQQQAQEANPLEDDDDQDIDIAFD